MRSESCPVTKQWLSSEVRCADCLSYHILGLCDLLELKAAASAQHVLKFLSCEQAAVEQWNAVP